MTRERDRLPSWNGDEDTGNETPSASRIVRSVPPSDDDLYTNLGKVMARAARTDRKVTTLASDFAELRRELAEDRGELVKGASRSAAKHSSNRLAVIMAALFSLYEVTAPYVHDIWKAMHQ